MSSHDRLPQDEQNGIGVSLKNSSIGSSNAFGDNNTIINVNGDGAVAILRERLAGSRSLHQIAAPPRDFVGREAELRELREAMIQDGVTVFGLAGMGGMGKTVLAQKLAAELEPRYPDAALYLDLRGVEDAPVSVVEALQFFIRAFQPVAQLPDDVPSLRGIYLSQLHNLRAIVLLDNAKDEAQVKPLLPSPLCAVIVTSRQFFAVPGLHLKRLDTLSSDKACDLLLEIAPRIGGYAAEMARVLGYLPLALRVAASALARRENLAPQTYLNRLAEASKRLELVAASLQLSYDLLGPALQLYWQMLAVFPDSFDEVAAAAIWEVSEEETNDMLGELQSFSVVEWNDTTNRYRLHDLARDFAFSLLQDDEAKCFNAQNRHAIHYVRVLESVNALYLTGNDAITQSLQLFNAERTHIEAGQSWAKANAGIANGIAQLCIYYPDAGAYVLSLRQTPHERIAWLEAALAAARQLENRQAEGRILGNLGPAYGNRGEARRAIECYEQSLIIMREIGDRLGESRVLGSLGNSYGDLGKIRRSIKCYEQSLTIARQIGDRRGEGSTLGNLGIAHGQLGETRRAIEYHERRLIIAHGIGDRSGEVGALGNLGTAYRELGETRRAIEYYEQSLTIAREVGDLAGEGAMQFNMSLILYSLGERRRAIALLTTALAIFEQIEDPDAERVQRLLDEWRSEMES